MVGADSAERNLTNFINPSIVLTPAQKYKTGIRIAEIYGEPHGKTLFRIIAHDIARDATPGCM